MQLLESSIGILDSGVSDYPRLANVLQTTRVRRPEKKTGRVRRKKSREKKDRKSRPVELNVVD
jgi:hypothetical protein